MRDKLGIAHLGMVDYAEALELQRRAAAVRAEGRIPDLLGLGPGASASASGAQPGSPSWSNMWQGEVHSS